MAKYGYINRGSIRGDEYVVDDLPPKGDSEYLGPRSSSRAGAGRGVVNPPSTNSSPRTGIEKTAAEAAFKRDYDEYGPSQGPSSDDRRIRRMQDAASEARDEIHRETRGKAYAKGGSIRGDGCAVKGKTKGRFC